MASTIYSKAGTDAAIAAAVDAIPAPSTGGSVTSVNGQTGAVALDAADVGADPAGTAQGLVDALVIPDPDLSGYVQTTDPRLSDARLPTAHGHPVGDITGLQAALDGKQAAGSYAPASHGHTAGQVSGLATVAATGAYADLTGKPTLGTAAATASTDYAPASHGHPWSGITDKPATFPPDAHTHDGSYGSAVWMISTWSTGITCPDTAQLGLTGDIDIRVKMSLPNWGINGTYGLASKFGVAGNKSWLFNYGWQGELRLIISTDGTATRTFQTSTSYVPSWIATPDAVGWVRVTLDVDNGAGGATATFYESVDGVTWTLIRAVTSAGVASIFASTSPILLGSDFTNPFTGKMYAAEIRSGIGGPVVASWKALGSLDKFRDRQGNIWTITAASAAIAEA